MTKFKMDNKIKILITIIIMFFLSAVCFPQKTDSLKKGTFYKITLDNGSIIKGKVITFDTSFILLNTKNGMNEIKRQNILKINPPGKEFYNEYFTSFKKSEYRNLWSFNIGFISPNFESVEYNTYSSGREFKGGLNLSLFYTGFFSRHIGVRTGVAFSLMKNKDIPGNEIYDSDLTGGNLSQTVLILDLISGMFHPEKKINYYGFMGIGFGTANSSEVTYSSIYYGTYSSNPEPEVLFKFGFGAGMTYRLNEKYSLQTEICYDYITPSGYYGKSEQLIIKAGIIFINL